MSKLQATFEKIFNLGAPDLAEEMLNDTDNASASSLRNSLKQLSGGLMLKTDILTSETQKRFQGQHRRDVSLIESIPKQYFTQIEGAVYRSITTGNGLNWCRLSRSIKTLRYAARA